MNNRLYELRKTLKLTQRELGQIIGVKDAAISKIENGENNITEQNIKAICRELGVSEAWLRTGEGKMFVPTSRDEEIAAFIGGILGDETEEFKKRFFWVLSTLNNSEWLLLEKMAFRMAEEITKRD